MNRGIVASGVGRMFNRLIAVAFIGALVVDLDDNRGPQGFAVAWIPVAHRLEVPASTTGGAGAVDKGAVPRAIDGAIGVLEGKGVDGSCPNSWDGRAGGPTSYGWTTIVIPGEGGLVDWQLAFEERIRRADEGRSGPQGGEKGDRQ